MNTIYIKKTIQTQSRHKGAALLMAVLISAVMLSVGLGVYQRTYKQLVFASFWKQVQIAFAAADGGLECALYWDLRRASATSASCFGSPVLLTSGVGVLWNPSANLSVNLTMNTTAGCVIVDITKNVTTSVTTIQSRGYNDACGSISPRRVERGLRIEY